MIFHTNIEFIKNKKAKIIQNVNDVETITLYGQVDCSNNICGIYVQVGYILFTRNRIKYSCNSSSCNFPIKHAFGNSFYLYNGSLINIEIGRDLIHPVETAEKLLDLSGRGHDTDMQSTFYARFVCEIFKYQV